MLKKVNLSSELEQTKMMHSAISEAERLGKHIYSTICFKFKIKYNVHSIIFIFFFSGTNVQTHPPYICAVCELLDAGGVTLSKRTAEGSHSQTKEPAYM